MQSQVTSLQAFYAQHQGKVSDKWSSYLTLYDQLLNPVRNSVESLLEIGVQNGGSLALWSQYFPNAQHIVGCDIDARCADLRYDDARIHVIVADATLATTRDNVAQISASFDVVIEDGSHIPREVIGAFLRYWPMVKPGGIFIAEDLHCDYFPGHEGGVEKRNIANRFFAELVHIINFEHWEGVISISKLLEDFASAELVEGARLGGSIASVSFHNSVAVVRKANAPADVALGHRVVAGNVALVDTGVFGVQGSGATSLVPLHERRAPMPESAPTTFSGLFAKR